MNFIGIDIGNSSILTIPIERIHDKPLIKRNRFVVLDLRQQKTMLRLANKKYPKRTILLAKTTIHENSTSHVK